MNSAEIKGDSLSQLDQVNTANLATVEVSAESLLSLANRRREALAEINEQLTTAAKEIVALIPDELSQWANESHLANPENIIKMITCIGVEMDKLVPYRGMSEKLKSPEEYGFSGHEEALAGMKKLKAAWKGVIDVRIGDDPNYTEVYITPVSVAV